MARSYNTPSTTSNHENSDATLMEFFTNNAAAINAILHQHSSTETFNSSTDDLAWNNAVAALHNITHSRPATPVLLRRMYATSNAFSPQPSESSTVVSPAVSQPASPPPLTVISPAVSQPASPPPLSNTLSLAHNDNNYSDYTQYDDYSSYNNQQSQPNDFRPRSTLIPRVLPPINWPSDLYPPIQPTAELQAQTPFPNMESSPVARCCSPTCT
ncbi:hypothetical protein JR316_0007456 [Psilocybe cubensis]|uniref:Uncharacterized protein n=2 Tax=Psilocybe cubensis TaxID=181762 RepID=A0A8H8CHC4_PSICU|nr:hypothetical protein JR316_0007456 [Psilocybe cubensis]KAH9480854.1 hypothetical protein JR316_0007456 [Psilocybe cubensis]